MRNLSPRQRLLIGGAGAGLVVVLVIVVLLITGIASTAADDQPMHIVAARAQRPDDLQKVMMAFETGEPAGHGDPGYFYLYGQLPESLLAPGHDQDRSPLHPAHRDAFL